MIRIWNTVSTLISDALYTMLIDCAVSESNAFLLAIRHDQKKTRRCENFLNQIEPYSICKSESMEWPGTKLSRSTALVCRYQLCQKSAELLKKATNSLFGWIQPNLPEDLCFLRGDQDPWLISIAHERFCAAILSTEEKARLLAKLPSLQLIEYGGGSGGGP